MSEQDSSVISSLQNQRVKDIVRLRQRSHRDDSAKVIIEGTREIQMALNNGVNPDEIYFCNDFIDSEADQQVIEQCRAHGAQLYECTKSVLEKIAYRDQPQGLLAIAPAISKQLQSFSPPTECLIVIAEAIEKPGNLGAILRTCDAAGVDAVILCDKCTDINNPNVIRASTGTVFSVPVFEATSQETIEWLEEHSVKTISATPSGNKIYSEINMTGPTAVVVGAEKPGLSELWLSKTDDLAVIPMKGQADSLNVSQATTILLYEALRQRSDH
ncbi:rRNA methyltransferase [bacterium E08(2017)]|nr:rRNA methyltransferase [bacterium E08(2017)]